MKILEHLTQKEAEERMPRGLVDALHANSNDVEYCMICDGTRIKGHECVPIVPPIPDHPGGYHDFIKTENGDWLCTICGHRIIW